MKRLLLCFSLFLFAATAFAGSWIRINQLGYLPKTSKVAVFMSEEAVSITSFQLIDVFTGKEVYTSKAVKAMGALGGMKATYRLNFSDFTRQGTYRIKVGATESPNFPINGHVYDGTADFALNYMRQQRCGFNPFMGEECHQKDGFIRYHPTKEGQHIDVRGGWHDAADLLQYTNTSANAIYQMLFAYKQNPDAFGDYYQANGLPGANGIPDIIDEIYWGLDWLDRMNPEKGELYNQIADDRDHIGQKLPQNDPADYGRGPNNGRPVYFVDGKPQQRGKFMNATMGAGSTAGKFASDFAFGAEVLKPFYPEFAKKIAAKAADALQVGIDKPGNTQTVSVVSPYIYEEDNWVDDMELGAIELFRATGDAQYLTKAVEYGRREPVTPWMGADSARHYQWYPFMNMGHYQIAATTSDARLKAEFLRNMRAGIARTQERALAHPFMWGIPGIWCSNNLTTAMLTQCILYRTLSGDNSFEEMEGSLRDWLFGCNPWGTSMIVGLPQGGTYPHATHSNWVFQNLGHPVGGLVDGPVYSTIFNSLRGVNITDDMPHVTANAYLRFQPGDVVYHDNTHDYSTNEPTMDGTACLTFPLSFYQSEGRAQVDASQADRNVYDHGGIIQADSSQKKICLVFTSHDKTDGAQHIISTLKKRNVKGAFFFTGTFFESFPDIVKRIQADGHYIGSHSYGHLLYAPWEKRDSLLVTKEEFTADMLKSFSLLQQFGITKEKAPYFIPPYEYYNSTVASWAHDLGLQIVNFTPGTGSNDDYTWPGMPHEAEKYRSSKWLFDNMMKFERNHSLNGHFLMIHLGTDPARTDKFYNKLLLSAKS
ncbi:MAG: glycoside hydrolase family 9 protein [Bacteroidales bacterium]|nr:glycoside hydrolase family 9 protein [Bacteroidales bacterium]